MKYTHQRGNNAACCLITFVSNNQITLMDILGLFLIKVAKAVSTVLSETERTCAIARIVI